MVSVPGPTRASCVRARRSAPDGLRRKPIRPGTLGQPAFPARHVAHVGACGISQVSWRSILCLCPAPRPRPSRQDLALAILPMLPPGHPDRRPQRVHNLEANTGLQHPLSTLHERRRRRPCKTRFRLAGCASTGRGSNPLDRFERFQVTSPFSFPGLLLSQGWSMRSGPSPDPRRCSTMSARYTHRVAISNNRLVSMDDGKVCFRWKDYVRREGAGG